MAPDSVACVPAAIASMEATHPLCCSSGPSVRGGLNQPISALAGRRGRVGSQARVLRNQCRIHRSSAHGLGIVPSIQRVQQEDDMPLSLGQVSQQFVIGPSDSKPMQLPTGSDFSQARNGAR